MPLFCLSVSLAAFAPTQGIVLEGTKAAQGHGVGEGGQYLTFY